MRLELLQGHDATVAAFVAQHAPLEQPDFGDNFRALGILRHDGALIGGVVFSGYRPEFATVEMSGAFVSYYALSPRIVSAIGAYVFGKPLAINRLWARTALKNPRANKLLSHIGFTRESVSADHYGPGVHAVTWRLLKREWEAKHALPKAA